MKKVLAAILSALVSLSFAGIVLAEEPAAIPAGHPPIKAESKKATKKVKKAKKAKKKDEAKPAAAPAAPAAPAAK